MEELSSMYGISKIETSPYCPQSNGIVERLHGTLVPMLKKCSERKTDWAQFLHLSLYALRLTPNSATGASPYLLVHGRELHSPVDLLYSGWVEDRLKESAWALEVAEQVEIAACLTQLKIIETRKEKWDRTARERTFADNYLVLLRTPGLLSKIRRVHGKLWSHYLHG